MHATGAAVVGCMPVLGGGGAALGVSVHRAASGRDSTPFESAMDEQRRGGTGEGEGEGLCVDTGERAKLRAHTATQRAAERRRRRRARVSAGEQWSDLSPRSALPLCLSPCHCCTLAVAADRSRVRWGAVPANRTPEDDAKTAPVNENSTAQQPTAKHTAAQATNARKRGTIKERGLGSEVARSTTAPRGGVQRPVVCLRCLRAWFVPVVVCFVVCLLRRLSRLERDSSIEDELVGRGVHHVAHEEGVALELAGTCTERQATAANSPA